VAPCLLVQDGILQEEHLLLHVLQEFYSSLKLFGWFTLTARLSIKSLSHQELLDAFNELGFPKFRVQQVEQWLWQRGAQRFDEMTNLSKQMRSQLDDIYYISNTIISLTQVSCDGTRKYLLTFDDGVSVEAVGIPSHDFSRLTVCFSTQAGCAMNCSFCATGKGGFTRDLTIGEMFDQVRIVGEDFGIRVSNVVAMGQGEPFLNYDAVLGALRLMNDVKVGLGIGARHITVSTCGILEGIKRFSQEPEQFTLAISLHSALQPTRDSLMPGVASRPLDQLRETIRAYIESTNRRPTFEYAMIQGINDSDEHLDSLLEFCDGLLSHVNLIPLNPITDEQEAAGMMRPSDRIHYFQKALMEHGIEASIRESRGSDIDGACGQLTQKQRI